MVTSLLTVDIDVRVLINAFEIKLCVRCYALKYKTLAVPPNACRVPSAFVACGGIGLRLSCDALVVRQLHCRPILVNIIRLCNILHISKHETPACIK